MQTDVSIIWGFIHVRIIYDVRGGGGVEGDYGLELRDIYIQSTSTSGTYSQYIQRKLCIRLGVENVMIS